MSALRLFQAFGIELEYMVVDRESLAVRPIVDELFKGVAGRYVSDIERPECEWSNELVAHVVELKTRGPAEGLTGLAETFGGEARHINRLLEPMGACLMPTGMHPWMDPYRETTLWRHDSNEVYEAFNRIFDCRGHGWSNLQSMHVNLPFAGDEEFGRLHAAIRLVLPLLPALAASSPFADGQRQAALDHRLQVYRVNSARIPSLAGEVIPEPYFTRADYEQKLLGRLYADIAPHDPDGVLQDEFLNARGAIARFGRGSIEIRVIDVQECPRADLAIAALVVATVRALVEERWTSRGEQEIWPVARLAPLLGRSIADADQVIIDDAAYLSSFGSRAARLTTGDLWRELAGRLPGLDEHRAALGVLLEQGPLARRLVRACPAPSPAALRELYARVCACLDANEPFSP